MGIFKSPKVNVPAVPPPPPPAPTAPAWSGSAARRSPFDASAALGGTFLTSGMTPLGASGKKGGKSLLGL